MSWKISLPYRDRSDRFDPNDIAGDIAEAISDPEERAVTRALALELALEPRIETMGDALDAIENADPATRRALLDRAREGAGLLSTERTEQRRAYDLANPQSSTGARSEFPICAAPECRSFPVNEVGAHARTHVRRWWCAAHEHLAQPGDLEPRTSGIRYTRTGSLEFADEVEAEAERARVEAESRRKRNEAREAQRREEGERLAELEAARDARFRSERFAGFRP